MNFLMTLAGIGWAVDPTFSGIWVAYLFGAVALIDGLAIGLLVLLES